MKYLIALLLSLSPLQAQAHISLLESKIRALLKNNSTVIVLPFDNPNGKPAKANLTLTWLDAMDRASGTQRHEITIAPGNSTIEIPQPITHASIWARLRYTITPDKSSIRELAASAGTVALSQIADYVFEVQSSYGGRPERGRPITVHAQAIHPVSRLPIPNVDWSAELSIDDKDLAPKRVVKREDGFVDFIFEAPPSADEDSDDDFDIEITAKRGDFEQSTSLSFDPRSNFSGRFQTDKPIYQPGQTLHLRAVISNPQGRPAAGAKVSLQIDDAQGERAHTVPLVASKFGIIQQDWPIPASAALGVYRISLVREGDITAQIASHAVRVSRYELPTFSVTAQPDRTAYLPGQSANVSITGTYLFGKPVPNGRVKLVRSLSSTWNPATRKYDSKDEVIAEGEAQPNGVFTATVDLSDEHEQLKGNQHQRLRDLDYIAYFTDPSSRRTEQRRFTLRLSREPIHVYVIPSHPTDNLPTPVYISTSYADGRPAMTSGAFEWRGQSLKFATNRYGIGKVLVPDYERLPDFTATDAAGLTGTGRDNAYFSNPSKHRLDSKQTLHRAGQSVTLQLTTPPDSPPNQAMLVEAIAGNRSVASRVARVVNHSGEITFPFQPEFRRGIVFVAWDPLHPSSEAPARRAVIFPDGSDLTFTAKPAQTAYKPGENAALNLSVAAKDGTPVAAAVGLAIVDQSVLERARTDSEFGRRSWFFCAFCNDEGENEIGGVRLNDLYRIEPGAPITPQLDLVAEALVANSMAELNIESSESIDSRPNFPSIQNQIKQLKEALHSHHGSTLEFPTNFDELNRILRSRWTQLSDPWDRPYFAVFAVEGRDNVVRIRSSGPDKLQGTEDDFEAGSINQPYFTAMNSLIKAALKTQRDYPATVEEFAAILANQGLLLNSIRDPWGTPYRPIVITNGPYRNIRFKSAGPDKTFETRDDFEIATYTGGYFHSEEGQIRRALNNTTSDPQSIEAFRNALSQAGVDIGSFRDPWGHPYRLTSIVNSVYADRVRNSNSRVFGGPQIMRTEVTPVTEQRITFSLRSNGPDGVENTLDDFDIRKFTFVLRPESSSEPKPTVVASSGGSGVIAGLVTDSTGSAVPNVILTLKYVGQTKLEVRSDEHGVYQFTSLPNGLYTLEADCSGFRRYEVTQVPVQTGKTTIVDIQLEVGTVAESVSVESSGPVLLQTLSASVTSSSAPTSTPRVRDYFPETLLWLPELLTGPSGATSTKFKLADSITTWKVAAFASTLDGRTAEAEADLRVFQPFFLDFNPPVTLTEGDQIDLPVTIRNYQAQPQAVSLTLQPNTWSALQSPATQTTSIPAGSSQNLSYQLTANRSLDKAPYRLIAKAGREGDAIEKASLVHPDGQQVVQNFGDLLLNKTTFSVRIPTTAISTANRGELRIYPNFASLLIESANSILIGPHGCAEQTISAGFANLTALRFARAAGIRDAKIETQALKNIHSTLDAIKSFRTPSGGLRYWSGREPDIAVTAHAVSFLVAAIEVTAVDRDEIQQLIAWLEKVQSTDGRWQSSFARGAETDAQTLLLTSHVLRALGEASQAGLKVSKDSLASGYHHMANFTDSIPEPYMLANFILAALSTGDAKLLGAAPDRLMAMARSERGGLYWDLQTNTPFYGWGTAGRYETTALAVSALSAWRRHQPKAPDAQIRGGLVFLLRSRDNWGCWSSTQATIKAMRAIADASTTLGSLSTQATSLELRSGNRLIKTIPLPANPKATNPILVDISADLTLGENQLTLTGSNAVALVRLSTTHWLPWTQTTPRTHPELKFSATFDRLSAAPGEWVRCDVSAERVGFKGYGMMLAEVGLPPGAEVDRASLEEVIPGLDHFEIHPDKVVFYIWPQAGGVKFHFLLTPRFGMRAKNTASTLYDYYNPEALAEIAPNQWMIGYFNLGKR